MASQRSVPLLHVALLSKGLGSHRAHQGLTVTDIWCAASLCITEAYRCDQLMMHDNIQLLLSDYNGLYASQELQHLAAELSQAGASINAINMAASPHMLRNKGYTLDIVRVGAALYGQQETVPGTRSAARWLSRIVSLKKVSA